MTSRQGTRELFSGKTTSRMGGISLGLRVGGSVGETLGTDEGMTEGFNVGHGSARCPK
eukprot:CAMPEP_0184442932 /NCGR_PEP_ID=MMETSP0738-20130409/756843_1 /TAXON_ID=385413 /ORGANISM="Thalassiosira miniscula, Strain CCMP1093" /LENGTH=57 /DNA_ID=CAMNT_0026810885 /DNA_START=666 /DNA_END=839 /DNA_ORIENTATION=+